MSPRAVAPRRPPALALFDFDGTLAHTAPDMLAALRAWRAARGLPANNLEEAASLCSGGARALLQLTGWAGESFEAARDDYLRRYEQTAYRQTALFAGVEDMLRQLQRAGVAWGVATNKPRRFFEPICDRLNLRGLGGGVFFCGDDKPNSKPHPQLLLAAARAAGAAAQQCVYVGDDIRDAQAAACAGMPFVGVFWGYWRQEQWDLATAPPAAALASSPPPLLAPCAPCRLSGLAAWAAAVV